MLRNEKKFGQPNTITYALLTSATTAFGFRRLLSLRSQALVFSLPLLNAGLHTPGQQPKTKGADAMRAIMLCGWGTRHVNVCAVLLVVGTWLVLFLLAATTRIKARG